MSKTHDRPAEAAEHSKLWAPIPFTDSLAAEPNPVFEALFTSSDIFDSDEDRRMVELERRRALAQLIISAYLEWKQL